MYNGKLRPTDIGSATVTMQTTLNVTKPTMGGGGVEVKF